jgi:hypothetical protein
MIAVGCSSARCRAEGTRRATRRNPAQTPGTRQATATGDPVRGKVTASRNAILGRSPRGEKTPQPGAGSPSGFSSRRLSRCNATSPARSPLARPSLRPSPASVRASQLRRHDSLIPRPSRPARPSPAPARQHDGGTLAGNVWGALSSTGCWIVDHPATRLRRTWRTSSCPEKRGSSTSLRSPLERFMRARHRPLSRRRPVPGRAS